MFTRKSRICPYGSSRKSTLENSQFIQTVREEDRRDKILEDVFMQSTEENPYLKKIQSFIPLCYEIKKDNQKKFVQASRDLVRRQNNDELKLLETQLRAAYCSKAIAAQKFEIQALKTAEKAKAVYENVRLEQARLRQVMFAKQKVEEERKKKAALKQDLLDQIAVTEAKRQAEKIDRIKEKQAMDDIVRKYKEEDLEEARLAFEKKIKIKAAVEEFERRQKKWQEEQIAARQQASAKIDELIKQQELERAKVAKAKRELKEHKFKISEEIGKQTHAIKVEEIKSFDRLTELLIDERKAKDDMKHIRDQEKQMQLRIVVRQDLDRLLDRKMHQQNKEKRMDEEQYQEEMRLLAERDKLQQSLDEKKRKETQEHKEALLSALDEKRMLKAKEIKKLLILNTTEIDEEDRKNTSLEEVRIKMLQEHGPDLVGFLPPRLLRESDRKFLPFLN